MKFDGVKGAGEEVIRVAHISDIHFGRISHPTIVETLVTEVNEANVDLVVASGDLTQRAFPWQYREAAAMLASFDAPWLAIPGNHDVFPWWRTYSRLFDPLRRFRNRITEERAPRFTKQDLAVLGINSATGRAIKNGKIEDSEREAMQTFFRDAPGNAFRILVVHHHLQELKALGAHDVARGAEATLACAAELDVDLILCGHLHVSHVETVVPLHDSNAIVIATAGTATSDRGRKPHKMQNIYNQIVITNTNFDIVERQFNRERVVFEEVRRHTFQRAARVSSYQEDHLSSPPE